MVNYQLMKLGKYHGKTLFISNSPLRHNIKGTQRKLKYNSRYHDRTCNSMVQNN